MPLYTSSLAGDQWLQELINGHKEQFYNKMGMSMCTHFLCKCLNEFKKEKFNAIRQD
jgi:hypothetical protein